MTVLLAIPEEFGYVIGTGIVSIFMLFYLGENVASARKRFKVEYPKMYDDSQPVFNCYQRAHQNTLENTPAFMFLLVIGGVTHPLIASASALVWTVGRIVYAWGYWTGIPSKRGRGNFAYLGLISLLGCSISTALHLLKYC